MFSRPVSHKRQHLDRELTFRRPGCACFACYDTGVVTNGDGLVNQLLPDYDACHDGTRIAGMDAPLICPCPAAARFRTVDGVLSRGRAVELTREQADWLHEQRAASWSETERLMRDARMAHAAGDPEALPWFIAEVRAAVQQQAARAAAAGADLPAAGRRLQPLGGVIAQAFHSTPSHSPLRLVVSEAEQADPTPPASA